MTRASELGTILRDLLPDFRVRDCRPLEGGFLNFVWRVRGEGRPQSVIVKQAPPFVATLPEVRLDSRRARFEAEALQALGPGGELSRLSSDAVRPPVLVAYDDERKLLVLEDLGELPGLGEHLGAGRGPGSLPTTLGRFIGGLHGTTFRSERLAARFCNSSAQQTRNEVQYGRIGEFLRQAGIEDSGALGRRAAALGERLLEPGACLIMGDLWPPSVLVDGDRVRVIDWELVHFGNPAQDTAHLGAHLWMEAHRAESEETSAAFSETWRGFLDSYSSALGPRGVELWTSAVRVDAALHFACEILARTVGPFRKGHRYDGLPLGDAAVREAVSLAVRHLESPADVETFSCL